jgi:hypothetical protein
VSKTDDKKDAMGEAHEEAVRLAFKALDPRDERAQLVSAETIWKNTESRSRAQVVDAVSKEMAMGLPFEIALEKLDYSPTEIDRILAIKEAEALLAPPPPPPVNEQQPEAEVAGVPSQR